MILEELTRFLNMEKLLPSYNYTVTKACMLANRKLQKTNHLPSKSEMFRDYAAHSQFVDVRVAALECLVDYVQVDGSVKDLDFLIDMVEKDPVPYIRHKIIRLLVDNPPFKRNEGHRNDKPELAERLWHLMKYVDCIDYFLFGGNIKVLSIFLPLALAFGTTAACVVTLSTSILNFTGGKGRSAFPSQNWPCFEPPPLCRRLTSPRWRSTQYQRPKRRSLRWRNHQQEGPLTSQHLWRLE